MKIFMVTVNEGTLVAAFSTIDKANEFLGYDRKDAARVKVGLPPVGGQWSGYSTEEVDLDSAPSIGWDGYWVCNIPANGSIREWVEVSEYRRQVACTATCAQGVSTVSADDAREKARTAAAEYMSATTSVRESMNNWRPTTNVPR